jgi:hypothetical protein
MQLVDLGSHSGLVFRPLGCNVVLSGICSPTFRRNVLSPSMPSRSITGYFLGIVFDPKIDAVHSSETSTNLYRTTRHHIPEDRTLHGFNYSLVHTNRTILRPKWTYGGKSYDLYKKVMGSNLGRDNLVSLSPSWQMMGCSILAYCCSWY